jgi:O-antigen/teichoic acid export membrane protein
MVAALRNPLYRSGYALVVNTAGTTVIGVAYWAVAAHLYDQRALGRASALVSALLVISSAAQLNLSNTLPRFLPLAFRRSGRLIGYSYGVTSLTAVVAGVGFVLIMPLVNSHWRFLGGSATLGILFAAAAVIWGIFALEDAALTGLRHTGVVPVENTVYGVLKLALLVAIAGLLPSTGIFLSWVAPLVLIIPVINVLIFRRYLRQGPARVGEGDVGSRVRPREVIRFASVDYIGALLNQVYSNLLPLLVLSVLGAAANGRFYVAWTITTGLVLVATNFATSLLVEGASAPEKLAELTRGVLARCALVLTLGVAILFFAARPILSIYGSRYADQAASLLGLLALGVLPRSLIVITFALDRLAGKVGRATLTNLVLTVLVLGGSWVSLTRIGILGVALAWCVGNLIVAIVRLPTIVRAVKHKTEDAPVRAASIWRLAAPDHAVRAGQRNGRDQLRQPGRHRAPARAKPPMPPGQGQAADPDSASPS